MSPLSAQQSNFHMCITLIALVQVLALKKKKICMVFINW